MKTLAQIWSERRKIVMLALLAALLTMLLARQSDFLPPTPAGQSVRRVARPVVLTVAAIDRWTQRTWRLFFHSRELLTENQKLRTEIALLRVRYERMAEAHAQLQRLTSLTDVQPRFGANVTANIIGISPNFWTRTVTIDRGREDGVQVGMPVINQEGLVGIVRDATIQDATVLLLTDPDFAAGAMVRETRDRGVIAGTGEKNILHLILDNPQTHLEPAYEVITSGIPMGSLFRKGTTIGTITSLARNKFGQQYALVEPNVHFDRLEEVVVLLENLNLDTTAPDLPAPPL